MATYADSLADLTSSIIDYYTACGRESVAGALDSMMDSPAWCAHCAGDDARCGYLADLEISRDQWTLPHDEDVRDIGVAWGRAVAQLTEQVCSAA